MRINSVNALNYSFLLDNNRETISIPKQKYKQLLDMSVDLQRCEELVIKLQNEIKTLNALAKTHGEKLKENEKHDLVCFRLSTDMH